MSTEGAVARAGPAPVEMDEAFGALQDAFEGAVVVAGSIDQWLTVAGLPIRLRFAGPALVPRVMPAFAHLVSEPTPGRGDVLTVCLWDSASTRTRLPPTTLLPRVEDAPSRYLYRTGNLSFVFRASAHRSEISFLDAGRGVALHCADDAARFPLREMACPLRAVLTWWLSQQGLHLVHAAAVGNDGGGVLVVGPGRSGKSTTALACLAAGFDYAGDDYVVVSSEPPHVHSAYCAGKLAWSDLARHPALLPDPVEPAAAGERHKDDEKAIAFLAPALGARISRGFPVRAVVLPRVSQRARTTLVPITAARALLASAPSTVLQLPGDGRAAFDGIGRLVRQVPSFQLDLGRDRAAIPQVVAAVLEQA